MILFKNNYYEEDERLFSTGDEELDDLLEEVYYSGISDGYDYAQKEFTRAAVKDKVVKNAFGKDGIGGRMAKRIRSGQLGKEIGVQEAKNYGGYGKWHRDLVKQHEAQVARDMTHREKMLERKRSNMMKNINGEVSIQERLKDYRYRKANGLL